MKKQNITLVGMLLCLLTFLVARADAQPVTKISTFTGAHYKSLTTTEGNYHWEASMSPTNILDNGLQWGSGSSYFEGLVLTTKESVTGKNIRVVIDAEFDVKNAYLETSVDVDGDVEVLSLNGNRLKDPGNDNEAPVFVSLGKVNGKIRVGFKANSTSSFNRYGRLIVHSITITEGEVEDPVITGPMISEAPFDITVTAPTAGSTVYWDSFNATTYSTNGSWSATDPTVGKAFHFDETTQMHFYAEKDGLRSSTVGGEYALRLLRNIHFNHPQPYRSWSTGEDLSKITVYCDDLKDGDHLMTCIYQSQKEEATEISSGASVVLNHTSTRTMDYYSRCFFVKNDNGLESDIVEVEQSYNTPYFAINGMSRNHPFYLSFNSYLPDNAVIKYEIVRTDNNGNEHTVASGTYNKETTHLLITQSCKISATAEYTINGKKESRSASESVVLELEPINLVGGASFDLYDPYEQTTGYCVTAEPLNPYLSAVYYTTDGTDPKESPTARKVEPYEPAHEVAPGQTVARWYGPILLTESGTVKARIYHEGANFWEPMAEKTVKLGINPDFHLNEQHVVTWYDPTKYKDIDIFRTVNSSVVASKDIRYWIKGKGLYNHETYASLTGQLGENYITMDGVSTEGEILYSTKVVTVLPEFNTHVEMLPGTGSLPSITYETTGGATVSEEIVDGITRKYINMLPGSTITLKAPSGRLSGIFLYGANDSTNVNALKCSSEENTYLSYFAPVPFQKYYYKWVGEGTQVTFTAEKAQRIYGIDAYLLMKPNELEIKDNMGFHAFLGQDFTEPTIINPNNLPLHFASSNEAVATVDEATGKVAIVGKGTCRILIEYKGEGGYAPVELSYDLDVIDLNDTEKEYTFVFKEMEDDITSIASEGKEIYSWSYLYAKDESSVTLMLVSSESSTSESSASLKKASAKVDRPVAGRFDGKVLWIYPGTRLQLNTDRYDIKKVDIRLAEGTTMNGKFAYSPDQSPAGEAYPGEMLSSTTWAGTASSLGLVYQGSEPLPVAAINVTYDVITVNYTKDFYFDHPDMSKIYGLEGNLGNFRLECDLSSDGWNTFSSPVDIPVAALEAAGGKVEVMALDNATPTAIYFTKVTEGIVAGRPYLVKTEKQIKSIEVKGLFYMHSIMPNMFVEGNEGGVQFISSVMKTPMQTDGTEYILDAKTEFQRPAAESSELSAMRAFFRVPMGTDLSKMSLYIDGKITAIRGLVNEERDDMPIYNLQGQQIARPVRKGIYIQNGKKVMK